MRKFIDRIIPRYAQLPLILCGVTQFLAYFVTKYIHVCDYVDMTTCIDRMTPVQPAWVTVYIASYIYWIAGYIAVCRRSERNCRLLCRADYMAKLAAALCFVLMPTTIARPEMNGTGIFERLLWLIYYLDTPFNLFPSLHCLFSWLLARELMDIKEFSPVIRWGAVIFSFMVFASTVFTAQHVVADIAGGVALAELARLCSHRLEKHNHTVEEGQAQ